MIDKETAEFIATHRNDDVRTLALQAKRYPTVDIREAVTQIEGWRLAKEKLPAWAATEGITYPPRISMEQCSSEATARYKSAIANGGKLTDLTGGFGIDCSYMSQGFSKATYIERNPLLCDIAKENFALLGLQHIEVTNSNSEEILPSLPQQDWIFIDPARRDGEGRKVVALSDCEPDVTTLESQLLQKSGRVMIKCSPMLDITAAGRQLKNIEEIHVVAVNNECKELLFILGGNSTGNPKITCANIRTDSTQLFTYTAEEEQESRATYCNAVEEYIYEPNAAIQKAGCYNTIATRMAMKKLHPNSQLYTSKELIPAFPGRIFKVNRCYGFSKKEIKEIQGLQKANITVRNFPENVETLRKRLKLSDGGGHYIFATTLANGSRQLIICHKAMQEQQP